MSQMYVVSILLYSDLLMLAHYTNKTAQEDVLRPCALSSIIPHVVSFLSLRPIGVLQHRILGAKIF
jgi:hypothetical protein